MIPARIDQDSLSRYWQGQKNQMAETICARNQATLITAIGNVIVIYRGNQKTRRFEAVLNPGNPTGL